MQVEQPTEEKRKVAYLSEEHEILSLLERSTFFKRCPENRRCSLSDEKLLGRQQKSSAECLDCASSSQALEDCRLALAAASSTARRRSSGETLLVEEGKLLRHVAAFAGSSCSSVSRSWRQTLRRRHEQDHPGREKRRWRKWISLLGLNGGPAEEQSQERPELDQERRASLLSMGSSFDSEEEEETDSDDEASDNEELDETRDLYEASAHGLVSTQDALAIELDLQRTLPEELNEEEESALKHVLRALCARHTAVGYCQGLNFVAAFTLRRAGGDGLEAFFVLGRLYDALDLRSVYAPTMPMLRVLFYQLDGLLARHLPALAAHFRQLQIVPEMYSTGWLVTLLIGFFGDGDCASAWDALIARIASTRYTANRKEQGWAVIFGAILASLRLEETRLLGLDYDALLRSLQNFSFTSKRRVPELLEDAKLLFEHSGTTLAQQLADLEASQRSATTTSNRLGRFVSAARLAASKVAIAAAVAAKAANAKKQQQPPSIEQGTPPSSPSPSSSSSSSPEVNFDESY